MSKEELKQKAEVCMHNILFWLKLPISKENVEKGGAYILKLLEPGEKRIEELEQKLEQTEKDLADYQFNYPKIKELEKENAELKEKLKPENCLKLLAKDGYIKFTSEQLIKAKDLIENIIRVTWGEGWNYSLDWKVKAEQFLKEIEK